MTYYPPIDTTKRYIDLRLLVTVERDCLNLQDTVFKGLFETMHYEKVTGTHASSYSLLLGNLTFTWSVTLSWWAVVCSKMCTNSLVDVSVPTVWSRSSL